MTEDSEYTQTGNIIVKIIILIMFILFIIASIINH